MSTLHERLEALADDAPSGGLDPALYDRARRYHRRRRAGTALVVAAAVLGVLGIAGGAHLQTRADVQPAAPSAAAAVPERLYAPSPWLSGTDDDGPLGRIAVLMTDQERKSWISADHEAVVGISATTGEYRFLDLPDDAGQGWALSPDGRRVAFWITGATTGTANTQAGQALPVTGLAVYDADTGGVLRYPVETAHGLMVDRNSSLAWADADHLVFSFSQWRGGDGASGERASMSGPGAPLSVWKVGAEAPRTIDPETVSSEVEATNGRGEVLVGDYAYAVSDGSRHRLRTPGRSMTRSSALSPSGGLVAYPRGNGNPAPIVIVGHAGNRVVDSSVPGNDETFSVFAWLDAGHLLAEEYAPQSRYRTDLYRVNIRTGVSQRVVRLAGPGNFRYSGQLATDLLDAGFVARPAPPTPWDPRTVAGAVAALIAAACVVLVLWRRRVRL
ncbi:hypothetical protein [Nocardioides acrostichi]|uniref:Uncharacterized protein n=1 Tax=Nocardioides acrostichi TaxID=2784339 RepID=A0A930UUB5_9ACTN|nr:hypothetical protein [Nocardioides acrostichi]MBF4160993.1 hypothetical protein [Nocardioides acrostichi]